MAKQLNVNLAFTADTGKARAELQNLHSSLNSLLHLSAQPSNFKFTDEVKEASTAVANLKLNLENATNVDTGKLDLGKFQQSMKASNMSIEKYRQALTSLGPAGEQSFIQLANSISRAEMPLRTTSTLMSNLWTTLKNTARWQISSSVLHGFMGQIQSAYSYAQDLNESLNNIRIVTGYGADEMSKFAIEANNAAKALSTTTTAYTNASLIFYQQGLDTKDVKERTDITIKLANVARQSVEETSDQLTSIWNNFAKEGENLERYADVLTALGAATASSTDEIAGGLEKFAAVADMIGLSYDYAASALATITAKTRQSEEVVGTALKTIFARIQGLNLGETLDDGTTLNKYSEALDKVGISIYDSAGGLKTMDTILNEMGVKWDSLNKAQQVALAQTVAGVRQYNQLVALMENWDFMQDNLTISKNATGELTAQAKIYAESWEAASKRVKAAAEDIFDSLLDDDFFITILNGLEDVLNGVGFIIDAAGGLQTVVAALGAALFAAFGPQLAQAFNNLQLNLLSLTKAGKEAALATRIEAQQEVVKMYNEKSGQSKDVANVKTAERQAEVALKRAELQQKLIVHSEHLTQQEQETLAIIMDQNEALGNQVIQYAKIEDAARRKGSDALSELSFDLSTDDFDGDITHVQESLEGIAKTGQTSFKEYATAFENSTIKVGDSTKTMRAYMSENLGWTDDQIRKVTHNVANHYKDMGQAVYDGGVAAENFNKNFQGLSQDIENGIPSLKSFGDNFVAIGSGLSQLSMGVMSAATGIKTLWSSIDEGTFSFETFLSVLTSLSMSLPMIIGGFNALKDAKIADSIINVANAASEKMVQKAKHKTKTETQENTNAQVKETGAQTVDIGVNTAQTASEKTLQQSKGGSSSGGSGSAPTPSPKGIKNTKLTTGGAKVLGGIVAAAAIAAVLIVGCVHAYQALNAELNKNEIAAEKAETAALALANAYTEAKQSYNDLMDSLSTYENARNSLTELTRGTAEFTAAITDANQEALQLIDTYSELINGRYTVDSDGLITIDEEAIEEIKQEEANKTQQAQSAAIIGRQSARDARYAANVTKTHRETIKTQEGFMTDEDWQRAGKQTAVTTGIGTAAGLAVGTGMALSGAAAGAAIGSAVPIFGTLLGAAAGLIIGGISGIIVQAVQENSETKEEKQALNSLQKEFMLKGESALTDDKIKEAYGKDLTDEEIKAIRELCYEMRENTLATEAENRTMAASILSDNEKVQNARDAENIAAFAGDAYAEASKEALEKYKDIDMANFWGVGTVEGKEAWQRYAESQGLSDLKGYKVTNYKKDGSVEYEYRDADGNKQKKTVTQDEWAAVLAAQDADAAVNEAGNKIVDIVSKLQESTVDLLSAAKTGDMSGLTVGELGTQNKELEKLTEEELHALGFEGTKEEIIAQIAEQQKANIDNIKLAANQYGETVGGLISTMLDTNDATIKNVTQGTLKAYADTLSDLALHGGEDVMKDFDSGLQGIMDTYSNKSEEIMSIANNIDWSQGESALQDFNYQLMKMGINIDEGNAEWQKLVSAMQNMNTSVVHRDLDAIRAEITDIKKLCSEIEIGSVISDEEFDKLIKYKAELADLFIMTADGYKYVGGGNLEQEASEAAYKQLAETKKKNQQARDADAFLDLAGWRNNKSGVFTNEDWYGLANGTDSNTAYKNMTDFLAKNAAEHVKNLGFDAQYLQDLANTLNSTDPNITDDQKNTAKELLQQFYQEILTLNENAEADLYNDTLAEEIYASTATSISQLVQMSDKLKAETGDAINPETFAKQLSVLTWEGANAAKSLSELQSVWTEALATGAEVNYEAYSQNLLRLAESYNICKDEAQAFQNALQSGNNATIKTAEENLEAIIMLGEAASEYGLEEKQLSVQANVLAKQYGLTAKAAAQLTVQNQRMNKGVASLVNNWKDWKKILTTTNKDSQDWIKSAVECTAAIANMVGASEDLELPTDFFDSGDNLALLDAAAQGSEQAIAKLGMAVTIAQIKMFKFQEGMKNVSRELINAEQFGAWQTTLLNGITNVQHALDGLNIGDNVYEKLGGDDWVTALNEMATATGMSVEQMNSLLNSMGVKAKVKVTSVKQEMMVPTYTEIVEPGAGVDTDGDGEDDKFGYKRYTVPGEPQKVQGYVQVAQISTEENDLGAPEIEYIGNGNISTSAANGGKIPEPAENKKSSSLTKKDSIVERYKEWDDALDDVADAMEDVNKQADRLYGANRINALKKQNELLLKQKELLTKKKGDVETDLKSDKNSLVNIAKAHGVNFKFDGQGNISNYTAEMTKLYNKLADVEATWADASKHASKDAQDEYEKNNVQPIRDKINEIKEVLGIYTNTRELIEDLQDQIDDAFYEWQDNNYEQLHYKLELQLDINDNELRMIDYYLNKISDDFYSMAEAAQFMFDKLTPIQGSLESYKAFKESLDDAYLDGAGEISQADYIDGLKESYEGILNNLEALQDLDKQMMHYYEDTLAAGMEELAQYTDHMEHLTGVLDHYHNLITMINGEEDYESIDTVLRGKATTLKNEVDVAASNYEMLKREQAAIQASYNNAVDENARELFANELKAINAQVDEAHETLLSKTEEWAEVQKVIMENVMKKAAHEMEQAFTSGLGFDTLSNSIERLSSLSDEYLTKTNQIYETQKLINTAQQASDNTTNNAAKIRLKNFQDEIAALQEKNKLTKLDLDIAKAKYDVLLAEIALEEAQNAKATVRLQRDNEGNYGYVYTADQQKVAEAEQNLADTQNALYNVRLEAANNYGQKIMELNQKLYDDMAALEQAYMVDSTISEEEYNQQKEMLLREYYDLYEVYSHNYTTAMEEDAAIQTDAWVTAYEDIINSVDQWQQHINIYSQACEDAYQHYRSVVEFESDIINDLLSDVAGSVKEVTTESDTLKNKVIGEVIPSLESQLGQVRAVTSAYAAQRTSILELMTAYEALAESILEVMRAESMRAGTQVGPPEDFGGTEPQGTQSEGSGSPAQSKAARVQQLIKAVNAGAVSLSEQGWAPSAKSHGYSEEEIALARQAFTQSRETLKTSDPTAYAASVYNYDYYAALDIASRFKSGGYTGAWGPEGRMAILDEKELVLNARDTENFLMATGILRSISDVIDINSLHNQISQLSSISMTAADRGMLEQQVSIEAHFPNVSDRNEIEEAFNNLINTASQYANRKF